MGVFALATGCASLDLARAGHDIVQTASCELSEPRGSCNGDWGDEYQAWKVQRSAYLKELEEEKRGVATEGWFKPVDASGLPEL